MSQHEQTSVIVLTPEVVASHLEEVISDLTGFIMPALEAAPGSVNAAVVCQMDIARLQELSAALKGGA